MPPKALNHAKGCIHKVLLIYTHDIHSLGTRLAAFISNMFTIPEKRYVIGNYIEGLLIMGTK